MIQKLINFRVAILFALLSWAAYGAMVNVRELEDYGLYQVGVESLVDFQTYTIGHSHIPDWKDSGDGDVFTFENQKFPAKQPGSFFLAAIPYFFFHHVFGLNYYDHKPYVASLNTWFSAGLITATAVAVFYELLILMTINVFAACFATASLAFGTILFPYTGVPHHDVMAASTLIFAFYYLIRFKLEHRLPDYRSAGTWLGLTLFFSMLPALIVAVLLIYGGTLRKRLKDWIHLAAGFILGYLPLGLFNYYYFHNPFTQANMAGNYQDTFFKWSWETAKDHFNIYFGVHSNFSIMHVMPVFAIGMIGIFFLHQRFRKETICFFSALVIHATYLCNIQTIGHCQFGPRYFIPIIPFMLVGYAAFMNLRSTTISVSLKALAGILAAYSILACILGALGSTMYCAGLVRSPLASFYQDLPKLAADQFILRPYSGFIFATVIALYVFTYLQKDKIS